VCPFYYFFPDSPGCVVVLLYVCVVSRQLNCAFVHLCFINFIQQLSPTIQGSEPDHEAGLEQTLFDRLIKMVSCMKAFC